MAGLTVFNDGLSSFVKFLVPRCIGARLVLMTSGLIESVSFASIWWVGSKRAKQSKPLINK